MAHLLHIDSSVTGERSVSRRLSARAAAVWQAAHPGGTITYRDLAADPVPHIDAATGLARQVPPDQHTPAQRESWALSEKLVGELREADTVLLGLPLYNFGAPSVVKSWVDHLIAPGLSLDPETRTGYFEDKQFIVVSSRGGGYDEGTPREGWDHAEQWLPHGLAGTGIKPHFIIAQLTLASVVPAMAELIPLAEESMASAEKEIDELWASVRV